MNERSSYGFTIIEVILFLGISGLILVGAFAAMRTGIANSQFNDTTDTTQSYFQKQYLEVATGINDRSKDFSCNLAGAIIHNPGGTANPGTSDCVILGRLFQFSPGSGIITSRYLSSRIAANTTSVSDINAFAAGGYQVVVSSDAVPQFKNEFEIPWSATVKSAKRHNSSTLSNADVRSLAVLRSPVSERMMIYAFTMSTPGAAEFANVNNLLASNNSLLLCLQSDTGVFAKKALMEVGPGQGQDLFDVDRSNSGASMC